MPKEKEILLVVKKKHFPNEVPCLRRCERFVGEVIDVTDDGLGG